MIMSHNINFDRKLVVAIPLTTDGSWQQLQGLSSIPWDCVLFFQPSMHVHWSDCKRHSDCDCSITACLRAWQSISWASVVSYFFNLNSYRSVLRVHCSTSTVTIPKTRRGFKIGPTHHGHLNNHWSLRVSGRAIGLLSVYWIFYLNIWRGGSPSSSLGEGHKS